MRTRYMQPKFGPESTLLSAVKAIYGNIDLSAEQLQHLVVSLVRRAVDMSKREVMDKQGDVFQTLDYLFRNSPKGLDRGTLSAWFVAYTPVRPRFKDNGHYNDFGFARKPVWDVDGATNNMWYNEDPESTRKVKLPKIEKQVELLMIQAAKLAAVSDFSIAAIAEQIRKATEDAESAISAKMSEDSVIKFVDQWAEQNAPASEAVH